jgi:hypothetical protein
MADQEVLDKISSVFEQIGSLETSFADIELKHRTRLTPHASPRSAD